MSELKDHMPALDIHQSDFAQWGARWLSNTNDSNGKQKKPKGFDRHQSVNFASFIDAAFSKSLAAMLGDIPIVTPTSTALHPAEKNCVELGATRIIGGIRPQNFDVAYRPDGPRVVFDSKTLNDRKSVGKNWQNMINDLATESATIHTRFPYALVCFAVVFPAPALAKKQQADIVRTLERLGSRKDVLDQDHLAEAITFIIWNPEDGTILEDIPDPSSSLRIERFTETIYPHYVNRYKGLPPHQTTIY